LEELNEKTDSINTVLFSNKTDKWRISKDRILICRDCEHRYICMDSREPEVSSVSDLHTYDSDCRYNPYIALWGHEKGYETVKKSIEKGVVSENFVNRSSND